LTGAPQVDKTTKSLDVPVAPDADPIAARTLASEAVIKESVMLRATEVIGIEEDTFLDDVVSPWAEVDDDDEDDDDWDLDADDDVDELEELGDRDDWGTDKATEEDESGW